MLRSLLIKNFKRWKDSEPIKLAPLTLFFGNNSSGKSSIGQFLLLLKQTAESPDRKAVLFGGDEKTPANLGSFNDLIYRHDVTARLGFCIKWTLREPLVVRDALTKKEVSGDRIRFEAELGLAKPESSAPIVEQFEYRLTSSDAPSVTQIRLGMARKGDSGGYKLTHGHYKALRRPGRKWALGTPSRYYGFPDEVAAYYQNVDFAQDFSLELEKLLRRLSYLGPLRERARRLYTWSGMEPNTVGFAGEDWIGALLAAKDRKLNFAPKKHLKPFAEIIASSLHKLGIIDAFEVRAVADQRREYEVKVKTPGATDWVNLVDVGFGVSQVLPVLVQCFYAPPGSIILIEQPELHLHPKAQTNLADVLIDVINAREDEAERGVQLLVESHSEHFLRRLQRRVADESLAPEKIAAYFSHVEGEAAHLEPLNIDLLGNITNWPPDFFGDTMTEAVEMTRAQASRQPAPTAA